MISDEEIRKARADLAAWHAPQEFFTKVESISNKVTSKELFNSPKLGFLLDAMILAEYAVKLPGARSVRLATESERFPDGFVDTPDGTLNVEVTEADREGRRRGDEYKSGIVSRDSVVDWQEKAKAIPVELERVIKSKVNKNYDPKPTLVVYLNLDEYGTHQSEITKIIEDTKKRHASSFKDIHVLWKGQLV